MAMAMAVVEVLLFCLVARQGQYGLYWNKVSGACRLLHGRSLISNIVSAMFVPPLYTPTLRQ